ncbi:hypothetical protein N9A68_05625 [Cyclobacteriaceae bacterium]|nr:hypothetical protein [Cyclobacteriaceae bacterium]
METAEDKNKRLYKLIYDAFNNEIAIQRHLMEKYLKVQGFVPFKILQFSSLFLKPSFFYSLFLRIFCGCCFLLHLFLGVLLFILYPLRLIEVGKRTKNLIITSNPYKVIVREAITQLKLQPTDFIDASISNLLFLVRKTHLINFLFFFFGFTKYLIRNAKNPFLFLLQYTDLLRLYLVSAYIIDNPNIAVITEDHYQRFPFIVSNLRCSNFIIVQHGYIDDSIHFPSKFGRIDNLFIRDIQFLECFDNYYDVISYKILVRNMTSFFSKMDYKDSCFLASSSPHIDSEIKFVEYLKK